MSKMSELHVELSEQAYELGFNSLDDALSAGYQVDYEECRLLHPHRLVKKDEQEKAHEEWLEEKNRVLANLKELRIGLATGGYKEELETIDETIEFIEKGEM